MFVAYDNVNNYFNEILSDIDCQRDTKAYIISIYDKYKSNTFDLSNNSITLLYAEAKFKHNFSIYQNLGDWLFYTRSIFPSKLDDASEEYYNTIAQSSYYSCYKLINKQWKLFEELSDEYLELTNQVKTKIEQNFNHKILY